MPSQTPGHSLPIFLANLQGLDECQQRWVRFLVRLPHIGTPGDGSYLRSLNLSWCSSPPTPFGPQRLSQPPSRAVESQPDSARSVFATGPLGGWRLCAREARSAVGRRVQTSPTRNPHGVPGRPVQGVWFLRGSPECTESATVVAVEILQSTGRSPGLDLPNQLSVGRVDI